MTEYWIGFGLLVALAIAFIILPLVLRRGQSTEQHEMNVQLAKARLKELESEKSEALIAESDYQAAIEETKASLVLEETKQNTKSSVGTGAIAIVSTALLGLTVWFYLQSNNIAQVAKIEDVKVNMPELGKRIVLDADNSITTQELVDFALGLRLKLQNDPEDHLAWLLLGRVLASINDLEGALNAFDKSLALKPEHTGLLMSYSQTLLLTTAEENLTKAVRLLTTLLSITDDNLNAKGLLAIANTRLGRNEAAIANWQDLASQLPADSPMQATVEQQLADLLGTGTAVAVTVNIDETLAQQLPQNGFVFVFLQNAETEMKMPAAVVKKPFSDVSQLLSGFEVVLDKKTAMLPSYDIDSLNSARLIARISADEQVDVATGELQGMKVIPILKGERSEQAIVINQELP
ncbi:MAG: c-type cytochrome biogenesis protein CcmI [Alteromonadaceae bacterium]|nr:c-type cytochrome biogenesis protein CcmI [Alteromonadaceae bacterium]